MSWNPGDNSWLQKDKDMTDMAQRMITDLKSQCKLWTANKIKRRGSKLLLCKAVAKIRTLCPLIRAQKDLHKSKKVSSLTLTTTERANSHTQCKRILQFTLSSSSSSNTISPNQLLDILNTMVNRIQTSSLNTIILEWSGSMEWEDRNKATIRLGKQQVVSPQAQPQVTIKTTRWLKHSLVDTPTLRSNLSTIITRWVLASPGAMRALTWSSWCLQTSWASILI